MAHMYMKMWIVFRKAVQKINWARFVREVVAPFLGIAIVTIYVYLIPHIADTFTRRILHQGIESSHLTGIPTRRGVIGDDKVLDSVESVLHSLYTNYGLYWGNIVGMPTLRQVRTKQMKCMKDYVPDSSCQSSHLTSDQVNKSCFKCLTTLLVSPHNCSVSGTESKDTVETTCPMGKCEPGFGYCSLLGDVSRVKNRVYPSGGHGLHMDLNREYTWLMTLERLRDLHWLDRYSHYVSFSLTALSNIHICRIQLHFTRIGHNSWVIFNETSVEKIHNYFPLLYKHNWNKNQTYKCDKIHRTIASWSVYHDEAETTEYLLLVLPILTLLLVIVETPHCGVLCEGRAATGLEHVLLVINVTCLVLHLALCTTLHLALLYVINYVCDPFIFGKPMLLPPVTRMLLLCLILLWWVKFFFHPVVFCKAMNVVAEVRQGAHALLWVLVFQLLVMVVVAVTLRMVRDPATASFEDSFITLAQEITGQPLLEEAWPSLVVMHLVFVVFMFPLSVSTVWYAAYTSLTAHVPTSECQLPLPSLPAGRPDGGEE